MAIFKFKKPHIEINRNQDGAIVITSFNFLAVGHLDVVGFDFAFAGAMGDAGGVNIVTANGETYYLNFARNHTVSPSEVEKILPILTQIELPMMGNQEDMPDGWKHLDMGMGNNLIIRTEYLDLLIKEVWHECPNLETCTAENLSATLDKLFSWRKMLPKLLKSKA